MPHSLIYWVCRETAISARPCDLAAGRLASRHALGCHSRRATPKCSAISSGLRWPPWWMVMVITAFSGLRRRASHWRSVVIAEPRRGRGGQGTHALGGAASDGGLRGADPGSDPHGDVVGQQPAAAAVAGDAVCPLAIGDGSGHLGLGCLLDQAQQQEAVLGVDHVLLASPCQDLAQLLERRVLLPRARVRVGEQTGTPLGGGLVPLPRPAGLHVDVDASV